MYLMIFKKYFLESKRSETLSISLLDEFGVDDKKEELDMTYIELYYMLYIGYFLCASLCTI